jgi:integrase
MTRSTLSSRDDGLIRRIGKRGVTWSIRYHDADGQRVFETLGREPEWNKTKAAAERRRRMVAVEDGYRKPDGKVLFGAFAEQWLTDYTARPNLKPSTISSYTTIVRRHLIPAFGALPLAAVTDDVIDRYVTKKLKAGLSGRTVNSHTQCLGLIFKRARKKKKVQSNPVDLVEPQKQRKRKWRILKPAEVIAVEQAYDELIREADDKARRADLIVSKVIFLLTILAGLRRGEVLGLRWRSVHLADPDGPTLTVEETWTRGQVSTPKSEAGERTIETGNRLASALMDHRQWSRYDGDDERVVAHPRTGHVYDVHRHAELFREALKRAGIDGYVRPFHDQRHAQITNSAAAGVDMHHLQNRSGHSSSQVTEIYVHLAQEVLRGDAAKLEERLYGAKDPA